MGVMVFAFILVAAFALGNIVCHPLSIGPEAACHLSASMLTALGQRPFVDFYEIGSQPTLYLQVPLVVVARLLRTHPILIFKIVVLALALLSATVLLALARLRGPGWHRLYLQLAAILVCLFYGFNYTEFGEAPLFFATTITPYLFARLSNQSLPQKLKIVVMLLLLLALLTAPIFVAYFLLVEFALALMLLSEGQNLRSYFGQGRSLLLYLPLFVALPIYLLLAYLTPGYLDSAWTYNNLYFKYFNDQLYWMEKSPDLRNLIYLSIFFLLVASTGLTRSREARLFSIASIVGFAFYITSVSTLSCYLMPYFYFALLAALSTLSYLISSLAVRFKQSLRWRKVPFVLLLLLLPLVILVPWLLMPLFAPASATVKVSSPLGFRGYSKFYDFSVFASFLLEQSQADDKVAIYAWQVRPAYPLLLQLLRRPSKFLYLYPFMVFKHGDPEGTEEQKAKLAAMQKQIYQIIEDELTGKNPPQLLLIEDGDIRQWFNESGLMEKISNRYELLQGVSPTNSDEVEKHPPFEYLAYRNPFAVYKLVR
ncbi:MAG: hypothetical protein IPP57_10185 [Candidatus Obscuribacter sp.]|jgi:hypothetical protein|nr:hypothetical protein [Candidatus Obscuribacter sp.]